MPEILRFFLSNRSTYISGQCVTLHPADSPMGWFARLTHRDAHQPSSAATPRRAVITGASGGIGRAITQRLATQYDQLILVDHPSQHLRLRQLAEQTGGIALPIDLNRPNAAGLISNSVAHDALSACPIW